MRAAPPDTFGPAEFQAASGVSRETLARLKLFVGLLTDWNSRTNLVSARSLDDVWRRHVWDSAQLAALIPEDAASFVDLGSGAGFPGLVLAVLRAQKNPGKTVLYEATTKKARFLDEVSRRLGLTVDIRNARLEAAAPEPFDVVTARACAPLPQLLSYAVPFQAKTTLNLFLKGQSVGVELAEARKMWRFSLDQHTSRSDAAGTVLAIGELAHA